MAADEGASDTVAAPVAPAALPQTPVPAHADLPVTKTEDTDASNAAPRAGVETLTPPPSSQHHRTKFTSPEQNAVTDIPSPSLNATRPHDKLLDGDASLETISEQIASMQTEELRSLVKGFVSKLQEAKTAAAHYKLQHQMSQMESGEAVERMAVEMEMAKREIEVLQSVEAQAKLQEKAKDAAAAEQTNFRQIHNDIYDAMCDEIRDLKTHTASLEQDLVHTRRVVSQQESEIASLNDKVSLMRDRIRESREQLYKSRTQGATDSTPRANKTITPFQTPSRDRHAYTETPSRRPQDSARSQHYQHVAHTERPPQQQQQGFAALLQATDMVRQGHQSPTRQFHRPLSHETDSIPSMPTTPSRPPRMAPQFHTPQPMRRMPLEVPNTAPMPRKRARDTMTPPPQMRDYDSDGTVSAPDADSEAETEVAPDAIDVGHSLMHHERAGGRVIKRAKSAFNIRGSAQSQIYGAVRKPHVERDNWEEKRRQDDARLGIQRSQRV